MPAHFIATKKGPIEPNLYQLMMGGLPQLDPPPQAPSDGAIAFLEVVWRKYGHHSPDHLLKVISRDEAFFKTMEVYPNGIIPLEMIAKEYRTGVEAGKIEMPKKYTQTGKVMTDWSIQKEGDPTRVINASDATPQKRQLTVAEELALEIARGGTAGKAEIVDLRQQSGFQGITAKDISTDSGYRASDKSTVVSELAAELAAKNAGQPRMSIEDAANAEEAAMRILASLGGLAVGPDHAQAQVPQKSTHRWAPEKAPADARILRSSAKLNSAPGGGLPWRKS